MPVAAITYSPIAFFTSDGRQLSIPGSALTIGDDGQLSVNAAYAEALDWLKHLFRDGVIRAGTSAPASTAISFRATDPGALGNGIEIEVSDGATANSYDIEVSFVSEYSGLTVANAKAVVGTPSTPGSQPGLLRISTAGAIALPRNAFSGALAGGSDSPATASHLDVPQPDDTPAFTVQAAKPGVGGDDITVTVTATGASFSLKAEWTRSLTGVNAGDISDLNSEFGYLVTASAPSGPSHLPQSGRYRLSGGVDSATASASAVARL